jgi:hypothetical protein
LLSGINLPGETIIIKLLPKFVQRTITGYYRLKLICIKITFERLKNMQDEKGIYYYPYPENKKTRMYIKKSEGIIWFRLWNKEIPELWDEHGWIPYDAILQASGMYSKGAGNFDPRRAYDIEVAKSLLAEKNRETF